MLYQQKRVATLTQAFNLRILVTSRYPDESTHLRFVDQQTLLSQSDFVIAYLINTAQAGLVDKEN